MRHNWRIIRAHSHAVYLLEALLFGLFFGWIYSFAPLLGLLIPLAFSPISFALVLLVVALWIFPWDCRHVGFHALRGTLLGFAASAALLATLPRELAAGLDIHLDIWLCLIIGSLLGVLTSILVLWLITAVAGQPIVQDGTRCPTCAYSILYIPSKRCPECGTAFSEADISPIPPSYVPQWRRAFGQGLFYLTLFIAFYAVYPYVLVELLVRIPVPASPGDWSYKWTRYLDRRPSAAGRALAVCLERDDRRQRAQAAEISGLLKRPNPLLEDRLVHCGRADPDPLIRQTCLLSLSRMNPERLADSMPLFLLDPDPMVRWAVVAALASGGSSPRTLGIPWLIVALDDNDEQVRTFAYQRLCENSGLSLPFDPKAPLDERLRSQAKWMEWSRRLLDDP